MNEHKKALDASAISKHAKAAQDIGRLLDVMELELQKACDRFGERTQDDPWGCLRANRMFRMRNDLIEMLAKLSGSTQEQIENFLADADA